MNKMSQEKLDMAFDRYAIFQTGGKQYQALEGKTVAVEKLDAKEGEEIVFKDVLLRRTNKDTVEIGSPHLSTAIKAIVIKHGKGPKVISFTFKRRKKCRRKMGHRQPLTVVRILAI